MDGVLSDFQGKILEIVSTNNPELEDSFVSKFKTMDSFKDQSIRQIAKEPGFFRSLDPIDGALEGWGKIISLGYHPIVCSSPLGTNPSSEEEKRDWLKKNLGDKASKEAIIDKRKYLYDGIALIDDRTDIAKDEMTSWEQIIFTQNYNQDYNYEFRLNGWNDPSLASKLEKCHQKWLASQKQ